MLVSNAGPVSLGRPGVERRPGDKPLNFLTYASSFFLRLDYPFGYVICSRYCLHLFSIQAVLNLLDVRWLAGHSLSRCLASHLYLYAELHKSFERSARISFHSAGVILQSQSISSADSPDAPMQSVVRILQRVRHFFRACADFSDAGAHRPAGRAWNDGRDHKRRRAAASSGA